MLRCNFCTTVFAELPEKGGCPRCGAPDPAPLKQEVVRVVETQYVFVPQQNYYTPRFTSYPISAARSSFYGTFGYKLATFILVVASIVLLVWFLYWLQFRAPALKLTDPSYQYILPTAFPTVQVVAKTDPWINEKWLSSTDALQLRTQTNVVNLARLSGGGAEYSELHSVIFEAGNPWKQTKPLGMTELSLSGTSVYFKAGGYEYTLNVFQPFILSEQSDKINVIDDQGKIWQVDAIDIHLISLEEVVSALPITLLPNPALSLSY